MKFAFAIATLWFSVPLCLGGQAILDHARGDSVYDSGLFTPLGDLSVLSETQFMILAHPVFPQHTVRIKKSSFCDGTVAAYTGYLDVQAKHLFFYFFESRRDPDKDDVILWTNGGPGASSSVGLFTEIGPCRILDNNGTFRFHRRLFSTCEDAAVDVAAFIRIFFEHFSTFKGRPFHLAGESYGGRYLPVYAAEVYDQNRRFAKQGLAPINLVSMMIGNGVVDVFTTYAHYYETACTPVAVPPVLDIQTCVRMKQAVPRCVKLFREGCIDIFDEFSCQTAAAFCDAEITAPLHATGINPYDLTRNCEGSADDSLCYSFLSYIPSYLNRPDVRKQIGIDSAFKANFTALSTTVYAEFTRNMDLFHPTHHHVAALLERGVKVLIYVGINDWLCNHVGNERWTLDLEWTHGKAFSAVPLREWTVGGGGGSKKAGLTRSFGGLTYATVDGAGHLVPHDKPVEALYLLSRWLDGDEL